MTFVLGLTGSIGMGKSTTAEMFRNAGVPVWDADAVVRRLYDKGGEAAHLVQQHYPDVMQNGAVLRDRLRDRIAKDPKILDHLQSLVHPLVAQDRETFLKDATDPIVLLDIPLLFEIGADAVCDGVLVVSVPPDLQRERVLSRDEMTDADFEMILSRQMPDHDKRSKADWVVETFNLEDTRRAVANIISEIKQGLDHA